MRAIGEAGYVLTKSELRTLAGMAGCKQLAGVSLGDPAAEKDPADELESAVSGLEAKKYVVKTDEGYAVDRNISFLVKACCEPLAFVRFIRRRGNREKTRCYYFAKDIAVELDQDVLLADTYILTLMTSADKAVHNIVGSIVIAVAGAMQRSGTTHTAISLAKFLYDNNFGVAVYEFHDGGTFEIIKNSYEEVEARDDMFSLAGMDFYPYDPYRSIADLLHGDYAYIVLDMGVYSRCNIPEFRRAHEKIIVCGVKDWEMPPLEEILKDEEWSAKYKYLFAFSDDECFRFVKDSMAKLPVYQAVYNPNPFNVSAECSFVYEEMLKDALPNTYFADEKKGVFRKAVGKLIKREDVLYHKPVLRKKLLMESRSRERKTVVDHVIRKRNSPLKLVVKIVVISALLTGIYYIITRFGIINRIGDFFRQLKDAFLPD